MKWGKALNMLWSLALALMTLKYLVDLERDGHLVFGLAVVILPLSALVFFRARSLAKGTMRVARENTSEGPEILRQLSETDRARIADLAESGRAIEAIKLTRELLPIGLRAAKEAVDQLTVSPR